MAPTLVRVAGPGKASIIPPQTPSEDFSKFQQKVPGMYFFLGINKAGADPATAPRNHSPYFVEALLQLGRAGDGESRGGLFE